MADKYIDRELGWDDEIERDGNTLETLPPGDYDFTVISLERSRSKGSENIPPSNMAVLKLKIESDQASKIVTHSLILHTKTEWKLCEFFTGIGLRKHGEKLRMDWSRVVGAKGRCKISIREYNNDRGEKRTTNQVDKIYEPEGTAPPEEPAQTKFTPGKF